MTVNSYRKKHGEKDRHEHSRVHFAPSVCRCPSGMPQHILRFLSLGQMEYFLFQTWTTPLLQSVQFSRSVVSNPLQPHGLHFARLPCPSFSAISKAMLVYIQRQFVGKWKTVNSLSRVQLFVGQSMDCSPPGSSVRGIFQARILQWVTVSFSRANL